MIRKYLYFPPLRTEYKPWRITPWLLWGIPILLLLPLLAGFSYTRPGFILAAVCYTAGMFLANSVDTSIEKLIIEINDHVESTFVISVCRVNYRPPRK